MDEEGGEDDPKGDDADPHDAKDLGEGARRKATAITAHEEEEGSKPGDDAEDRRQAEGIARVASKLTSPVEKRVAEAALQVAIRVGLRAVIPKPRKNPPPQPSRTGLGVVSMGFLRRKMMPRPMSTMAATARDAGRMKV